ncbi:hypothetical protein L7F22_012840 [Adiantum nelumboides]|nr:hypothetical protein [Adiantum nelumboides]
MKIHEESHSDLAFVFISDLHLDHPKTLSSFRSMLQGYLDADFIPFAFVLCGSFLENSKTGKGDVISRYQDAFSNLGDVLSAFPSIIAASHFVFVPSPSDPFSSPTLPRSALSSAISSKLFGRLNRPSLASVKVEDHIHFTSNPARLRYFGQDIVVFREDLMGKMLRNTIRLKEEAREVDLKKYLVSTILDQAHLCPLPQQARPVLWDYDHTLRLYPMPTAVSVSPSLS